MSPDDLPGPPNDRLASLGREDCTDAGWEVLVQAYRLGLGSRSGQIGSSHLFTALVGNGEGPFGRGLRRYGIDPPSRAEGNAAKSSGRLELTCTETVSKSLLQAQSIALSNIRPVAPSDLALGFVWTGGGGVGGELRRQGVILEALVSPLFDDDGRLDTELIEPGCFAILERARDFAGRKGYRLVGRRHLLYAFLDDESSELVRRLRRQHLDPERLADLLFNDIESLGAARVDLALRLRSLSSDLVEILCEAERKARGHDANRLSETDVLEVLVERGAGSAGRLLISAGVRWRRLMED